MPGRRLKPAGKRIISVEPSEEQKEQVWDIFRRWLVETIGVSDTFLTDTFHHAFSEDDDWSFVIRFHALIESGLNHLLANHFNDPRMTDLISDLPTHGRTSKMAFVKALNLLSPSKQAFVRVFSTARNQAVHDVRRTSFNLISYADSLSTDERQLWRNGLCGVIGPEFPFGGETYSTAEITESNPRYVIFLSTVFFMAVVLQHQERSQHNRKVTDAIRQLGELAFESHGHSVQDLFNPR